MMPLALSPLFDPVKKAFERSGLAPSAQKGLREGWALHLCFIYLSTYWLITPSGVHSCVGQWLPNMCG